jgi:hypothetical protein
MERLRFRFIFHLLFKPVVFLNRPDFVGVGTACFMASHAIDGKHLALRALDSRFVLFNFESDPLDLIPSDDVAASVDSAVGFYPVELIVAKATVLSVATPVFWELLLAKTVRARRTCGPATAHEAVFRSECVVGTAHIAHAPERRRRSVS